MAPVWSAVKERVPRSSPGLVPPASIWPALGPSRTVPTKARVQGAPCAAIGAGALARPSATPRPASKLPPPNVRSTWRRDGARATVLARASNCCSSMDDSSLPSPARRPASHGSGVGLGGTALRDGGCGRGRHGRGDRRLGGRLAEVVGDVPVAVDDLSLIELERVGAVGDGHLLVWLRYLLPVGGGRAVAYRIVVAGRGVHADLVLARRQAVEVEAAAVNRQLAGRAADDERHLVVHILVRAAVGRRLGLLERVRESRGARKEDESDAALVPRRRRLGRAAGGRDRDTTGGAAGIRHAGRRGRARSWVPR